MDRNEILKMSQKENRRYDEREREILTKSSAEAKLFGFLIGAIIAFIEIVFYNKPPVAALTVNFLLFSMNAFEAWYRFGKLKGKANLIRGIYSTLLALVFLVFLIHFFGKGY